MVASDWPPPASVSLSFSLFNLIWSIDRRPYVWDKCLICSSIFYATLPLALFSSRKTLVLKLTFDLDLVSFLSPSLEISEIGCPSEFSSLVDFLRILFRSPTAFLLLSRMPPSLELIEYSWETVFLKYCLRLLLSLPWGFTAYRGSGLAFLLPVCALCSLVSFISCSYESNGSFFTFCCLLVRFLWWECDYFFEWPGPLGGRHSGCSPSAYSLSLSFFILLSWSMDSVIIRCWFNPYARILSYLPTPPKRSSYSFPCLI